MRVYRGVIAFDTGICYLNVNPARATMFIRSALCRMPCPVALFLTPVFPDTGSHMLLKSLRTNILLNLALLLLIAMLLIDLVILIVMQKMLIESREEKGHVLISAMASNVLPTGSDGSREWRVVNPEQISQLLDQADGICAMVVSVDGRRLYRSGIGCLPQAAMAAMAHRAAIQKKTITQSPDMISGVFRSHSGELLMAAPIIVESKAVAGACLLLPLDDIFSLMRRSQHILLIYIIINTAVLTLLGGYRLNRITVKPIQRLVRRAEAFRESDDNVFMLEKGDNEFSQLSKSLNRMLMHLAQDKAMLQDSVSSLEKANRKLEKAQRELVRAEKLASVGRLSAGIAHEIGNPIGIIKGYLSLLNDQSISAEEKFDFIARTEKEVERINAIIQQLLDFARPSGKEQEAVSVHDILKDLGEVCSFQPALACIQFQLQLGAERDLVVANARQLRQVFLNLILNAADAVGDSEEHGELVIQTHTVAMEDRTDDQAEKLVIRFVDNGQGISDESLTNIFDPFFTTKAPGKGTGLGLSVSFTIIESLGGEIRADRNKGGGTCMTIALPLADGDSNKSDARDIFAHDKGINNDVGG
jgi:signal transduction histidine kinase